MTLDVDRMAQALPGYEIGREVGRGANGVVILGRHRQLGREVAIKELPRAFAADPAVRRRFVAEARVLASLDHPHIVPLYDFVEQDSLCLLVMEYLSGGSVSSRLAGGLPPMQTACALVLASCTALQYAHDRGVLHRDVKPDNMMFNSVGTIKMTDFGIAKVLGTVQTMATNAGEVLGTPAYMSPEQAMGHPLAPATDVYSLGVVLYELLAGRRPFADDGNAVANLYRQVHEEPVPLHAANAAVPPPVAGAVMHALAKRPEDRFQTAEQFGLALADATCEAWGAEWAQAAQAPIMAAGPIPRRLFTGGLPASTATAAFPPPPDTAKMSPPAMVGATIPDPAAPAPIPPTGAPFPPAGGARRRSRAIPVVAAAAVIVVLGALAGTAAAMHLGPFQRASTSAPGVSATSLAPATSAAPVTSVAPTTASPTTQVSPTSASLEAMAAVLPGDISLRDCTTYQLPGTALAGLAASVRCTDPTLPGGYIFGFQFQNEKDYLSGIGTFNSRIGFTAASATPVCPPSSAAHPGSVPWYDYGYPTATGQVLECASVGSSGSIPAYVWTFPTKAAFIDAQGATGSSFNALDAWWKQNGDPKGAR